MGHGVNSEGTVREIRGTRVSITVEWGGRGDCNWKQSRQRRRGQYIDSFDDLEHEFHIHKAGLLPHTRYSVKR